jgi:hypothetical protein
VWVNSSPSRPWRRRLLLETLEERLTPAVDPNTQFLLDSANRYAVSGNPADLGSPVVPLYQDYSAGGVYGTVDDAARVTLDGNDPDAGRGASSFRMSWDGSGANGYFQFGVGLGQANRPRDLPGWQTSQLRFLAKGDVAGRQVQVNVFQVSGTGFNPTPIASQWFTVGAGWSDFALALPATAPKGLHAVQFLMDAGHDPGGGTVRLDEVRFDANTFDPLRVLQSYVPLWAPTGSPANTPQGRDVNTYPLLASLYDNALAVEDLIASGDPAAQRAALDVVSGVLATAPDGTGGYFNLRPGGHVLLGNGSARAPLSQRRSLGDNSWFGLALLDAYRLTGATLYLTQARDISDWAEANLKAAGPLKGYTGGYDDAGSAVAYRATEHNIDLYQFNSQIAQALTALGDGAAPTYAARATYAGDFVIAMFDPTAGAEGGKFWTGTSTGDTVNTSSVPLDSQLWSYLTLGQSTQYGGAVDWLRPLHWAEGHLRVTDGNFTGFTFSSASAPARVWFAGDAFAAVEYRLLGQTANAQAEVQTLENARLNGPNASPLGRGVMAASGDALQDPSLGATYDARLAVEPSAWSSLAQRGLNPFGIQAGSAGGRVFRDNNGDGAQNGPDAGAPGWTVQLISALTGAVLATQVTDGGGNYLFTGLVPGSYRVREVPQNGWLQTTPDPADVAVSGSGTASVPAFGDFLFATLTGRTLNVQGTVRADQFTFTAGTPNHRITFDGAGYMVAASAIDSVTYTGNGGADTASLVAAGTGNVAALCPNSGQLRGSGYTAIASGVTNLYVTGGATDQAYFAVSAGPDLFVATPAYAYLQGAGFLEQANGFGFARADATAGGTDSALLYDSAGDDVFVGTPTYAYLQGSGHTSVAAGFKSVRATAGTGNDTAYLYDSAGDDTFVGTPAYAFLLGAGYQNVASGFKQVRATASSGNDVAYLYDSAGDDTLVATPAYAYLQGAGYLNVASSFRSVRATASTGNDTAYLYDSAGDDTLIATPTYAYLQGAGYLNVANGFKTVQAIASTGNDQAYLYDSAGNDVFYGGSSLSYLQGAGYLNVANGFKRVSAYSSGGSDQAYLIGTNTSADTFVNAGSYAYLFGSGFLDLESGFASLTVNPNAKHG